jgi:hypothetical protein
MVIEQETNAISPVDILRMALVTSTPIYFVHLLLASAVCLFGHLPTLMKP